MVNHPNRSRTVAVWFKLPGGLDALAVWRKGDGEGEIYADPTWQQNSDERTRRIAEGRADDAADADEMVWNWQPISEIDAISNHVDIPSLSR